VKEVTKAVRPLVDLDQHVDSIDPLEPGRNQVLQSLHSIGLLQSLEGSEVALAFLSINRSCLVLRYALINGRRDRREAIVQSRQKGVAIKRQVAGRVVRGSMRYPQGAGNEVLFAIGPSSSMGDGHVAGFEVLIYRGQSCRCIMRSREDHLTLRILANHVFDPPAWKEIDRRISERLAMSIAVTLVHLGDRTP
jgi:hypothetical protein